MAERFCGTRIKPLDGSYLLENGGVHALVTPGLEVGSAAEKLFRNDPTLASQLSVCLQKDLGRTGRQTFREELLEQTIGDLRQVSQGKRPLRMEIDW